MSLARDASGSRASLSRTLSFGLALGSLLSQVGCSSVATLRERTTALGAGLWHRPGHGADPQGYDLYADAVGSARKQAGDDTMLARNDAVRPGRPRSSAASGSELASNDPVPDAVAEPDGTTAEPAAPKSSTTPGRSEDSEIRVTLGRPESLPTLNGPETRTGSALASATSSGWQKRPETRPQGSQRSTASDSSAKSSLALSSPSTGNAGRKRPAPPSQDNLETILTRARRNLDAMSTYQVDITRVERVSGQLQPEEDVLLSIRRNPKAVRLEWEKGPNKGREVLYSAAANERMMYVHMANTAIPIPRMSIPVDSPLVLRNSRHAITEAGFDTIFDNLSQQAGKTSSASPASRRLVYNGLEKAPGTDQVCHVLERVTPQGETWRVYLDTRRYMPIVVSAYQANGDLLERYTYRNLRENVESLASNEAFDPDKRWGEPQGLFSRIARAASGTSTAPSSATTTR